MPQSVHTKKVATQLQAKPIIQLWLAHHGLTVGGPYHCWSVK